jgi:hypothetical protein
VSPTTPSALLLAILINMTACVGSGVGIPDAAANSGEVPTTFFELQTVVFDPMCAAQCHRGGAAPKGLSLEPGLALPGLVGVPSTEAPEFLRVNPGNPEDSFLVIKITPNDPRRVGSRMPRNGPPFLTDPQTRALKRWISAGATIDWVDGDEPFDAGVEPPDGAPIDASPPDAGG